MKTRWGIYHKHHKVADQYFCGFDESGNARWGAENESKPYDSKAAAEAQAYLIENAGYFRFLEVS